MLLILEYDEQIVKVRHKCLHAGLVSFKGVYGAMA